MKHSELRRQPRHVNPRIQVEMQKVNEKQTAYEIIVEETDPAYVNFEFDSYWMTDAGVNVPE